jgi:hypothetical protein
LPTENSVGFGGSVVRLLDVKGSAGAPEQSGNAAHNGQRSGVELTPDSIQHRLHETHLQSAPLEPGEVAAKAVPGAISSLPDRSPDDGINLSMAQKSTPTDATRPPVDDVLGDIAEYVLDYQVSSSVAEKTARLALMDALGCAFYSLGNPQCTRVLGPLVPGATLDGGALRTYRHAPNTGSRKSWAAPAAASRGVWLALM